jgi:hypothetical protein
MKIVLFQRTRELFSDCRHKPKIVKKSNNTNVYITAKFNTYDLKKYCNIDLVHDDLYNISFYIGNDGLLCHYTRYFSGVTIEEECHTEWCLNVRTLLFNMLFSIN